MQWEAACQLLWHHWATAAQSRLLTSFWPSFISSVLQAYAPLTAEQTGSAAQPRRLLYVFGCTAEGCGKQPGCWRALRLTLPSPPATSQQLPAQQQQQQVAPAAQQPAADDWGTSCADDWGAAGADDWGMSGGGDWGAAEGGAPDGAAAFDFGDLNAALEAVGTAASAAKPASKQQQQQQVEAPSSSSAAAGVAPAYDPAQPSLPAFYLFAEPESQCSASSGKQQRSEQEHLQQLMARYEAEAAAAGAAGAAMETAAGTACTPAVEGGPESWAGEGYEEDAVLAPTGGKRAGVGAPYFKFAKQLGRCSDQCARYRRVGLAGEWRAHAARTRRKYDVGCCGAELKLTLPLFS